MALDPHNSYWKHELKLPQTGLRLKGHSRSTEMTCFYLPELNWYFDAGVHSYYGCDGIALTHQHGDHFQAINGILKSQLTEHSKNSIPIPIYCPTHMVKMLNNYIVSYFQLNANNPHLKIHKITDLKGVEVGDRLPLKLKNRQYIMDIIRCYHSVPTIGFGLSEVRDKLNDNLKTCSQDEIIKLKQLGQVITHQIEVPLVCYLGDTTHNVFTNPKIFDYPSIIVECSFLYDSDLNEAIKRKHMHWSNLQQIIIQHPQNLFILIHFSLRYTDPEIIQFFTNLKSCPDNMVIWTDAKLLTSPTNQHLIVSNHEQTSKFKNELSKSMPNLVHFFSEHDCLSHDS